MIRTFLRSCSAAWSWWPRRPRPPTPAPPSSVPSAGSTSSGCQSGPVDGHLGEWTRSAVIRFQSRHRLSQTGNLNGADHPQAVRRPRAPLRRTTGAAGQRDRTTDRDQPAPELGVAGRLRRPGRPPERDDRQPRASSAPAGSGSGPTAAGPRRSAATHDASGSLVLQNFTRFAACGIGFHRIPTYRSGNQIHPDWMVGTNLRRSHGCIRLPKPFSARLWNFGRIGTRVRVVRG